MSWPGEAWQEGLPARALQGVRELEQRLEWANKERVQKQAQLDTLEAALHKQRQKVLGWCLHAHLMPPPMGCALLGLSPRPCTLTPHPL
uniref:Centromere protein Cenp-F N-terminal domain-containing protein n=1 Tax=Gopherus agassizii TaxID=38772 RepID=A0A452IEH4_9SAUR